MTGEGTAAGGGRPLIGLSTYLEAEVRWGAWELPAALLPDGYRRLVQSAGGLAALLPPDDPQHAPAAVARVDGLVVTGGPDVAPERYAAVRDPRTGPPAAERDAWELALLAAALADGTPVLAVCRGMQLLNVALGGTLVQHVDGHGGPVTGVFGRHPVKPVPGTRYAALVPEETTVATHHHQAVDRLGRGLVPAAHHADGTVEAVDLPDSASWVLGVQWHPETDSGPADLRVMQALVRAASRAGS